jgi:DNA-binding MarR family transcriptional regulator
MDVTGKIVEGINARTSHEFGKFIEETEGLEGLDIGFLQIGYAFSPDPLSPQDYIERGPYTNPGNYETQMGAAAERGWLEEIEAGQYKLSEKGLETVLRFFEKGNQSFNDLPALPDTENNRLANLLAKLVKEAYQLPEPASKPTMEIGMRLDPGVDSAPIQRIRRHLTDLNYYREDGHIAAWKPFYEVDGRVFETLTYLWRGEAATPAELAEQVSEYRNYDESDYTAAFEELVSRGWAATEDGKYVITEAGEKTRQEAEDRTDEYFARPFSVLSEAETEELKQLLEKLAETLKPPEEEEETSV